jgi:hypothetical protein
MLAAVHPKLVWTALLAGLAACGADEPTTTTAQLFEDDWEIVLDAVPFPADTTRLRVGGLLYEDNWSNRGDIEIRYEGTPGEISLEFKRFTFAIDEAHARENFERLQPWTYALAEPIAPDEAPVGADCAEVWREDCWVRVYYDGQLQPLRDGAHMRVVLPTTWEGELVVTTEDRDVDLFDEPSSDVSVVGARGSIDISMQGGQASVALGSAVEEAPLECDVAQHETCDLAAWDQGDRSCPCSRFGETTVGSYSNAVPTITVDVPSDLWATARLEALEQAQPQPEVRCRDFDLCEFDVDTSTFDVHATLNRPGPTASPAGGWSIWSRGRALVLCGGCLEGL